MRYIFEVLQENEISGFTPIDSVRQGKVEFISETDKKKISKVGQSLSS